jgi:hypothetical protein
MPKIYWREGSKGRSATNSSDDRVEWPIEKITRDAELDFAIPTNIGCRNTRMWYCSSHRLEREL